MLLLHILPLALLSFFTFGEFTEKCQITNEVQYVNGRICYDDSIFNKVTHDYRREMLRKFAPIAVYLQEVSGFPASVLIGNMAKEKGWKSTVTGNNHFGISCMMKNKSRWMNFARGLRLPIQFTTCGTRWQKFESSADSMIGYLYLLLQREKVAHLYGSIREAIPETFPPPPARAPIIDAISRSAWCQAGCSCTLRVQPKKIGSYGACMKSHVRHGCLAPLDKMTICNFEMEQLKSFPPFLKNISLSPDPEKGVAEWVDFTTDQMGEPLENKHEDRAVAQLPQSSSCLDQLKQSWSKQKLAGLQFCVEDKKNNQFYTLEKDREGDLQVHVYKNQDVPSTNPIATLKGFAGRRLLPISFKKKAQLFAFIDINNDGEDELVLRMREAFGAFLLMTRYSKGKFQTIQFSEDKDQKKTTSFLSHSQNSVPVINQGSVQVETLNRDDGKELKLRRLYTFDTKSSMGLKSSKIIK
ncbi:MAG: glucosaminidase domain-containing protein [Pseudomonadota bacterium]